MAVEGVMVSYNYSEDGELANILTVSASGLRFSRRWVLTHGSILSPLKEAKVIQNAKGKPILSDAFYSNLPEIHVTCEREKSARPSVYESVERLSRERDDRELEHSSYQIRVRTGRIVHIWQCPILDRCVDDILYSWTIGHRDGDVESQTQLGKALLSVFVLVDLQSDDRGQHLKLKWRNIRDCFVKAHKAKNCPGKVSEATRKKEKYSYYNDLLFLVEAKSIEMTPEDLLIHNDQGPVDDNHNNDNNHDEDDNDEFAWPPQPSNDPTALIPHIKIEYGEIPLNYEIEDPLDESNTMLPTKKRKHTESVNEVSDQRNKTKEKKIDLLLSGNIEDDDSVLFFISLVKEFKKVPEAKQLQTKLNILKLIQESQDPL